MLKAVKDGLLNRVLLALASAIAGAVGVLLAKTYPTIHAAVCYGVL